MHPKRRFTSWFVTLALALVLLSVGGAAAQDDPAPQGVGAQAAPGTAFTYQGQLKSNGSPVNAACDFEFRLFDAAAAGAQVGATQTKNAIAVANGLFTVSLDFGASAFTGEARWLDITVRCPAGGGAFTQLTPRQALTPAPYALALPGLYTRQNATSPNLIGGYSGNVISPTVVGGVIAGGGNSGNPNTVIANYATVGGGERNTASDIGATVGGGYSNTVSAFYATVGGGWGNTASDNSATVGGGDGNDASGVAATVGGGGFNTASGAGAFVGGGGWDGANSGGNQAAGNASTIGGGLGNSIPVTGTYAVVAGGRGNEASGFAATVGGGDSNTANIDWATVGGGERNTASGAYVTVGGGFSNTVSDGGATVGGGFRNDASGNSATVGGGDGNDASGLAATVPGGAQNQAQGDFSFAAGYRAVAAHRGAFVWADISTITPFTSTANHQFSVRAAGGTRIFSDSGATTGVSLAPGSGSWSSISDRNLKANFLAVDGLDILNRLAGLPVLSWNYAAQDASIRHLGPTAQDFHAAFDLGENDTTISTVDAQGVAFAAIQGLYQLAQAQDAQLTAQAEQITALEQQNASLEARLTALEQKVGGGASPLASGVPVSWLVIGALGAGAFWSGRRWNARKGGGR